MQKNITQMMNFKIFIKNLFYFILPLVYISYIIYIRVILIREARILYIPLTTIQIITTITIIILLLLRIYVLMKKVGFLKASENPNRLLVWVITRIKPISKYITHIWIEFYHKFTRSSFKLNFLILKLVKLLYKRLNLITGFAIIITFEILPKLILVTAFLVDVFVYQQFYYFYKLIFLLLLPLIYVALRGILFQFYVDNFDALQSFLDIDICTEDAKTEITYKFHDVSENPDYIKSLDDFLENHYFPVGDIINILARFDSLIMDYKINWLFLFILILHLLGWLTILFFGIFI